MCKNGIETACYHSLEMVYINDLNYLGHFFSKSHGSTDLDDLHGTFILLLTALLERINLN